jgi:aryl-alcohol dehydrogenase-like predicted oxidoreductase
LHTVLGESRRPRRRCPYFIDTADVCSRGESEEIVGRALSDRRDDVVLASKVSLPMSDEALALLAEEAGLTLVELAIAFVLAHPAVTSVIAGPRTLEHLERYPGAAAVTLGDDLLERIDQIVAPGSNVIDLDAGWQPPALADASQRRRG